MEAHLDLVVEEVGREQVRQLATPDYLALLANRDYPQLRRLTKMRQEDLQQAVLLIRSLSYNFV